ncbi:hypothetical protein RHMOL_Rhmol10G0225200 [Rhododendron molle]|uniref:Uncharacterized protein n=1 Tax=Rhododendron molle TaxID=49168 RepID=A0ACC0M641_RHOML|nr:hypothetical protein RHMOL_Rhmol10G0225200 [Rhododendron molle]
MEDSKEKNATPWLSVPQFGDWDQQGVMPDYSMDFTKIREMRKQNKRDVSRASLGNEEELISSTVTSKNTADSNLQHCHQTHSPTEFGNPVGQPALQDPRTRKEKHSQLLQLLCKSLRFMEMAVY